MDLFLLSALISFLSLDTTIAFQVLISSPLFACPLIGWLLGDVGLGFEMGFLFQLLWLGRIPAGAASVPEGNIASGVATALVVLNQHLGFPNTAITLIFLESIFVSYLAAYSTILYRKINGRILDLILKELENLHFKMMILLEAASIIIYALIMFMLVMVILKLTQLFLPGVITGIGGLFESQLVIIKPAILGAGLAFVFPLFKQAFVKKMEI